MKKIGIYNPYLSSKGGGEKLCLTLASVLADREDAEVTLITHEPVNLNELSKYFNIDLTKVKLKVIDFEKILVKIFYHLPLPSGSRFLLVDIYMHRQLKRLKLDVFINHCYRSNLPNVGKRGVYICMFPQKLHEEAEEIGQLKSIYRNMLMKIRKLFLYPTKKHGVYTYEKIISISGFTQKFVTQYWGLESEIVYPICEDMYQPGVEKRNMILHVGRFFGFDDDSHHKRQDILLDTFSKMKDLHKAGWELHFVGSVADDKRAKKFVNDLKESAKGLPVVFHFDFPFKELKLLFNEASVYWHATGYGSDPDKKPEKQEHFGITTVEAMSAGAIPIVINTAGQHEIVQQGKNGMLWSTAEELIEDTNKVLEDRLKSDKFRKAAKTSARKYEKPAFAKHINDIFDKL